jgi:FkbM family methyltransferase
LFGADKYGQETVGRRRIKSSVTAIMRALVNAARQNSAGRYAVDQVVNRALEATAKVHHGSVELTFAVPNSLGHLRGATFATKEPETLEWIDGIPAGSVFWDVGANVGLYSCYAAKARGCMVFSFEPSVFNLELLARNIHLNAVSSAVTIIPLPLNDRIGVSAMNMSSTDWGGALSTFGQSYGFDGKELKKVFEFRTIGLSMDDAVTALRLPRPDFVKMDVDGIEHLILNGAAGVLGTVRGISLEINDDFEEQARESKKLLAQAGLRLVQKKHSKMIAGSGSGFARTFNQVWER